MRKIYHTQPGESRKGLKKGIPALTITCPSCEAPIGKRCMMPPGCFRPVHQERITAYARKLAEA